MTDHEVYKPTEQEVENCHAMCAAEPEMIIGMPAMAFIGMTDYEQMVYLHMLEFRLAEMEGAELPEMPQCIKIGPLVKRPGQVH